MRRILLGPPNWFADASTAEIRRAIGFWLGMLMIFVVTPLSYPLRASVSMLWILSVGALILACFAMTAAETPVETED